MNFRIFSYAAVCMGALVTSASAQAPAANPLDVIPDAMPFNIPYGAPIQVAEARRLIDAVEAETKKRGWAMNIAVVDPAGQLIAFDRMDGAQTASIEIAQHKARTAAAFRRETKAFETAVNSGTISQMTLDGMIASRGGFPLVRGGQVVGAIGCSGGAASQDEAVCRVGAAMVK
jgi:uncharacterized protein GlcG (DUF336 family)